MPGPSPYQKQRPINPKDKLGVKKIPLDLIPPVALAHEAAAMLFGAERYEPWNWRDNAVIASIYIAACKRHLDAWMEREECAPDSLAHHLGHARACLGILLDAITHGCWTDDRPTTEQRDAYYSEVEKITRSIEQRRAIQGMKSRQTPSLPEQSHQRGNPLHYDPPISLSGGCHGHDFEESHKGSLKPPLTGAD